MASQLDKLSSLTLRNKSRRRPQISAPQPIAGPTPSERRPSAAQPGGGATSDLVKRRYSARFNQVPDSTLDAPPIPSLPSDLQVFKNRDGPSAIPSGLQAGPSVTLEVDLKALKDPSLPVEKCMKHDLLVSAFIVRKLIVVNRCGRTPCQCFRRRDSRLPTELTQGQEPYIDRFTTKCIPEPDTIHQNQ